MGSSSSQHVDDAVIQPIEPNDNHVTPPVTPSTASAVQHKPISVTPQPVKQIEISTPTDNTIVNKQHAVTELSKPKADNTANNNHTATNTDWWSAAFQNIQLTPELLLRPPSKITKADEQWLASFTLDNIMSDAKKMLSMSDTLPMVRFKLVPARINEYTFWKNLLLHLRAWQSQHTPQLLSPTTVPQRRSSTDSHHSSHSNGVKSPLVQPSHLLYVNGDRQSYQANGTPPQRKQSHADSSDLREQLKRAYTLPPIDGDTQQLKQTITKLETQLSRITAQYNALQDKYNDVMHSQQSQQRCTLCHKTMSEIEQDQALNGGKQSHTCSYHNGQWKLSKQSQEFFSLEKSLRDTLRAEKQKRIQAAISELKWITDTDNHTDAIGTWSCCNADKYKSTGCQHANQHKIDPT